jgi:hypothetical protein
LDNCLTYTDVCGNVKTDGATIYSNCHLLNAVSFDVVPNPAINLITISSSNKSLIYGIKQELAPKEFY